MSQTTGAAISVTIGVCGAFLATLTFLRDYSRRDRLKYMTGLLKDLPEESRALFEPLVLELASRVAATERRRQRVPRAKVTFVAGFVLFYLAALTNTAIPNPTWGEFLPEAFAAFVGLVMTLSAGTVLVTQWIKSLLARRTARRVNA